MEEIMKNDKENINNKEEVVKKERIYYFDNCKFFLILLVVLAHAISPLKAKYDFLYNIWYIINIFHMPALIFISGYFSKKYIKNNGKFDIQKPFTYFLLYTACQIAVSLFEIFVLKQDIKISFHAARSSLWFLQGLMLYYIVLPFIVKINKKLVIICSFIFGILIGYDEASGTFLNVMRGFVHFPFFIIGYYLNNNFFITLRKNKVRIPLIIVSVIFIILLCNIKILPERIIVCSYNYYNLKNNELPMFAVWLYRIGFYIISGVLGLTFMSIITTKKTIISTLGTRTLQVYILHRFLYLAELEYNWEQYFDSPKRAILLIGIAILLTVVLSQKVFSYPFTFIQRIKINRLLVKEGENK